MSGMTVADRATDVSEGPGAQLPLLRRIARGGALDGVLGDIVRLVEDAAGGDTVASILLVTPDGRHLTCGAAPSLPDAYNQAIDGIEVGHGAGSCGTAAATGEPVYVSDIKTDPLWNDFRDLALTHGLAACWSVPIKGLDGEVLGTFANYFRTPRTPTEAETRATAVVAQTAAVAVERHRVDLERQRVEEARTLLTRELDHRVKNAFALAQSLVTLSARGAKTPQEVADTAGGRLKALAAAHDLSAKGAGHGAGEAASALDLSDLADTILAPYRGGAEVAVRGDEVRLGAEAAKALGLILHELATNAAKHGALSRPDGTLAVSWAVGGDTLTLDWRERGGPETSEPTASGFGTRLLSDAAERQLDGALTTDWHPEGVRVRVTVPGDRLAV